jgi:CBS domain-containing protein
MYTDFQTISQDDEWYEGLEFDNEEELDMADAVKIQDPISSLTLGAPLVIERGTSLKNALNMLQEEKKNCLLVIDNDKLNGIITERDILLKVTGKGFDFELVTVDEYMTPDPEFLTKEDPIAYALNKMHVGGFRHVPIVNDNLFPTGLISIGDIISTIADYFSMEIINLPPNNRIVDTNMQEGG